MEWWVGLYTCPSCSRKVDEGEISTARDSAGLRICRFCEARKQQLRAERVAHEVTELRKFIDGFILSPNEIQQVKEETVLSNKVMDIEEDIENRAEVEKALRGLDESEKRLVLGSVITDALRAKTESYGREEQRIAELRKRAEEKFEKASSILWSYVIVGGFCIVLSCVLFASWSVAAIANDDICMLSGFSGFAGFFLVFAGIEFNLGNYRSAKWELEYAKVRTPASSLDDERIHDAKRTILEYYGKRPSPASPVAPQQTRNVETARAFLSELSSDKFEEEVVRVFKVFGYKGETTGHTGDYGVDALLWDRQGKKLAVQVKKYTSGTSIGRPELQKLQGAMLHFQADGAVFVTLSWFTPQAEDYAQKHGIRVIDGDEFVKMFIEAGESNDSDDSSDTSKDNDGVAQQKKD